MTYQRNDGYTKTMLFVVTEDWYFLSHRLPMARAARDSGYRVAVACRVTDDGASIESLGFDLFPLRRMKRGALNLRQDLGAVIELGNLIRRNDPDVVHLVSLKPIVLGMSAQLRRRPTICTFTGLGSTLGSQHRSRPPTSLAMIRAIRALRRRIKPLAVVQNRDDRRVVRDEFCFPTQDITLVPGSGVDPNTYHPGSRHDQPDASVERNGLTFAFVGRLLRDKGVLEYAQAAARAIEQAPSCRFLVIGDADNGSPNSLTVTELAELRSSTPVVFLGRRSDVAEILRECDVVVLPSSYGEGVPKSLLEGAASGLAMIATDVPGCRDLVRDGVNGLLVPPNDVGALANAMRTLADDLALTQRLGQQGRADVVASFSDEQIMNQMGHLYSRVADR